MWEEGQAKTRGDGRRRKKWAIHVSTSPDLGAISSKACQNSPYKQAERRGKEGRDCSSGWRKGRSMRVKAKSSSVVSAKALGGDCWPTGGLAKGGNG